MSRRINWLDGSVREIYRNKLQNKANNFYKENLMNIIPSVNNAQMLVNLLFTTMNLFMTESNEETFNLTKKTVELTKYNKNRPW